LSDIAERQFVRQQGFRDASATSCAHQYPALMFQPRLIAGIVVLAVALQSAVILLILAGVLWWSALVPRRNPFDALYSAAIARPRNLPPLQPAPEPRRFAQRMAGTLLAGAGVATVAGWRVAAWTLEGVVLIALGALVLGRFCVGSYIYHLLRGDAGFANHTLPWSRGE
jgi:hypothetical protein